MGLYSQDIPVKKVITAALFLILVILLILPDAFIVEIWFSKNPIAPTDETVMWVRVKNNSPIPLTGGTIAVGGEMNILNDQLVFLEDIPPGGEMIGEFRLKPVTSLRGDRLIRVFVSFPGITKVMHTGVRIE